MKNINVTKGPQRKYSFREAFEFIQQRMPKEDKRVLNFI